MLFLTRKEKLTSVPLKKILKMWVYFFFFKYRNTKAFVKFKNLLTLP